MENFLSTAGRYLKGESGLPSLLPTKAEIDAAKGKSRRVGLFCKALETFCEILYADPTPQEQQSAGQDLILRGKEESGTQEQQSSSGQDPILPEKEESETQEEQSSSGQDSILPGKEESEKPKQYVLAPSEDLFQSLYSTNATPPTSPGGTSSSSTLADPSSRRVSPSESLMGAKGSPTAVKDFAYSPLDCNHVRDPLSIVEENTKLELLKQLKKKTVGENKASRKAEKLKARNDDLKAELDATKEKLRNQEVRIELATVQANALILSNYVLRHEMQNFKHELSSEPVSAKIEEIESAGETVRIGQDEESIGYEGGSYGNYEFPEPAGPATLWGILQSKQCEDEFKKEADACEEAAMSHDAAGPATLWGILQSDPCENEAKKEADACVEAAVFPNAAGPATLWGILQSNRSKDEVVTIVEDLADVPAAPDQAGAKDIYGLTTKNIAYIRPELAAQLLEDFDDVMMKWQTARTNKDTADVHEIGSDTQVKDCDLPPPKPRVAEPTPQVPQLTKTQKRKLERKRAAAKKKETEERRVDTEGV